MGERTNTEMKREWKWAFILTESILKDVEKAMTRFGAPEYRVECADNATREFSLKELLDFPNDPPRAIRKITVTARQSYLEANSRSAHLVFDGREPQTWNHSVSLVMAGPEGEVQKLAQDISVAMHAAKAWYSPIARCDATLMLVLWSWVIWFAACARSAVRGDPPTPPFPASAVMLAGILAGAGCAFWLSLLVNRARNHLFPIGTFATKQGLKRHEETQTVKVGWGLAGFTVNVAAGLFLTWALFVAN